MNSAVSQQLLADFAAGDDVFPHQYMTAPDQILLVRLSGHAVREASFLDERVLPANAQGAWFAAAAVERAGESGFRPSGIDRTMMRRIPPGGRQGRCWIGGRLHDRRHQGVHGPRW